MGRAPRVEGQEAMVQLKAGAFNRGAGFTPRRIPAAFPSGKTGHISGAMDEPGMTLDKRRPQAPGVEAGITGT